MTEVVVTPEDREAAWPYRPSCYKVDDYTDWMAGKYDVAAAIIRGFARHRTLTLAQAAGPVLLEATIEQIAELQLAAFLAGRGSVITKDRGSTMTAKPAPTMDDFRRMARAAITQAEGPQ
jgi:hypothetical protein